MQLFKGPLRVLLQDISGQNTWFASIFRVYELSSLRERPVFSALVSPGSRKCSLGCRGSKIACKGGLFFYPT